MLNLSEMPEKLTHWMDSMREIAGYFWERGWAEANGGNFSADVSEILGDWSRVFDEEPVVPLTRSYEALAGRSFLITRSGGRYRDFAKTPEANALILTLSETGDGYRIIWGGKGRVDKRPTSEFPSHLGIQEYLRLQNRPERVVIHTHPTETIAISHMPEWQDETRFNDALLGTMPEVKVLIPKGAGYVPYAIPGSERLARPTIEGFSNGRTMVIWEMHGVLAVGEEPMEAFDRIDVLNKAAKIFLTCRQAGVTPTGLGKDNLDELVREFKLEE